MCTLTIIPIASSPGFRLVTNRDEIRRRPAASDPVVHRVSSRHWLWPVDPVGGGTWVAAGDHGLALSILNVNLDPAPALPSADQLLSRGLIIPTLASCADALEAADAASDLDLRRYAPFRLIIVDGAHLCEAVWNRRTLVVARGALGPACFVSHGQGDSLALPRLDLWSAFMAERGVSPDMQDSFHRHSWPERRAVSVVMEREDARTVSVTTIEAAGGGAIAMDYRTDSGSVRRMLAQDAPAQSAVAAARVRVAGPVRC